jgi:hypothetical protein
MRIKRKRERKREIESERSERRSVLEKTMAILVVRMYGTHPVRSFLLRHNNIQLKQSSFRPDIERNKNGLSLSSYSWNYSSML